MIRRDVKMAQTVMGGVTRGLVGQSASLDGRGIAGTAATTSGLTCGV